MLWGHGPQTAQHGAAAKGAVTAKDTWSLPLQSVKSYGEYRQVIWELKGCIGCSLWTASTRHGVLGRGTGRCRGPRHELRGMDATLSPSHKVGVCLAEKGKFFQVKGVHIQRERKHGDI